MPGCRSDRRVRPCRKVYIYITVWREPEGGGVADNRERSRSMRHPADEDARLVTVVEMRPTVEFVPMEEIYDPDVALKAYQVIDMRPKDE